MGGDGDHLEILIITEPTVLIGGGLLCGLEKSPVRPPPAFGVPLHGRGMARLTAVELLGKWNPVRARIPLRGGVAGE